MTHKFLSGLGRLFILASLVAFTQSVLADDYADYKPASGRTTLFEIFFDANDFGYESAGEDQTDKFTFDRSDLKVQGNQLVADGRVLIDADGFNIGPGFTFDQISDINVSEEQGYTILTFDSRSADDMQYGSRRRGYIIEPFSTVTISEDQFVRGAVFSVTGDIEVYGEVNRDVISLFGDLFIGPDAVVRGDVVALEGRIDLATDAAVYGSVLSGTDSRLGRRHKYRRFRNAYADMLDFDETFTYYNRVDGFALGLGLIFSDPDSALPTAWLGGGYAFESERWRYKVGLEQTLLRNPGIVLGAEAFRRLASGDDGIISDDENTGLALIAGEDYKDYYEAEGVRTYLRVAPLTDLLIETGYRYEETKWLEAERDLWSLSLSGRDKFRSHFSSLPVSARTMGALEIDTSVTASLYGQIKYDTRDLEHPFYFSAWAAEAQYEWSDPDIESSFDNTRYHLNVTRHQSLNRRLMAIFKGSYGGSDGYLPMHQRYYLGGIGTLRGYEHKELSGNYFWMINAEYRISFPRSDIAASVLWDMGQVSETSDFADSDVKHSLGLATYIGTDLKIGFAKRLDRSNDDDLLFFVRFAYGL